jgi:hypothetical protein
MPSTFRKTYDSFLLKFGIDLRYSRAYSKKREDLFKNDPEFRYCEHAFIGSVIIIGLRNFYKEIPSICAMSRYHR